MANAALCSVADEAPAATFGRLHHLNFVARRQHIGVVRQKFDLLCLPYLRPSNALRIEVDAGILWQVDDITEVLIHCIAFWLHIDAVDIAGDDAVECLVDFWVVMTELEIFAQIVSSEGEGAPCVFFFGEAVKVSGETNLCFDLFFAISEVVIRDRCDDYATGVTASNFEGTAVVVEFILLFPTHTVTLLAFGGILNVGQSELDLGSSHKMRREDDTTAVTCPMNGIEGGVVFAYKRVAAVAEDGFDEVEITN